VHGAGRINSLPQRKYHSSFDHSNRKFISKLILPGSKRQRQIYTCTFFLLLPVMPVITTASTTTLGHGKCLVDQEDCFQTMQVMS
jgi:hypothetical protein